MSSMFDNYIEDIKKDDFEKTAVKRPMAQDLKIKMKPQLLISYNPQSQQSQMMVKRLDNVLEKVQGLERMEITALNEMIDQAAIKDLGLPKIGLTLMVRGKKIASLAGIQSEMEIQKMFNANRGKLV